MAALYIDMSFISIGDLEIVDGVPVLIGNSSPGGNYCDGASFVVSFPTGKEPRFDGPIDACAYMTYKINEGTIVFTATDIPGRGPVQWMVDGLKSVETKTFSAEEKSGWNALRNRTFQHPADVFENVEITGNIESLTGARFSEFKTILGGVGGGDSEGDDYTGTACVPFKCGETEALIYLSSEDRKVFVASWKQEANEEAVVFPAAKEWPEKAERKLKAWTAQWP